MRLIEAAGSIDHARSYARTLATAAREAFDAAFASVAPGRDTTFLRAAISYMVERGR
jgi:hypothetical protein